ncbi:hypothetical protein MRB53_041847 [Persea americana]|nr:hypothetical protein MRB53_041847 [Persea americana]
MHADLYDWDASRTVPALRSPGFPSADRLRAQGTPLLSDDQALRGRHGVAPAPCPPTPSSPRNTKTHTFDFSKLARAQRATATIHERIGRGERQISRYFRVTYRGLGFPPNLRDRQFVFEALGHGPAPRRSSTGCNCSIRRRRSARTGPRTSSRGQASIRRRRSARSGDLLHPVGRRTKVAQPLGPVLVSKDQAVVIDKTIFTTAEAFPTILRRSEVVSVETAQALPLEVSLERVLRKTGEVVALERRVVEEGRGAAAAADRSAARVAESGTEGGREWQMRMGMAT